MQHNSMLATRFLPRMIEASLCVKAARLHAAFDSFTISALEDISVVRSRHTLAPGPPGSRATIINLGLDDLRHEAKWSARNVESFHYQTEALVGGSVFVKNGQDQARLAQSYVLQQLVL